MGSSIWQPPVGYSPPPTPSPDPPSGVLPSWCDAAAVTADVLALLRLAPTDPDAGRVQACVVTAAVLVDAWLDRGDNPLPAVGADTPMHPLARYGTTNVAAELYRRKDAPFGVLNAWSPDELQVRIAADPIRGSLYVLLPLKGNFGVAG